jgi:hypothetical protein
MGSIPPPAVSRSPQRNVHKLPYRSTYSKSETKFTEIIEHLGAMAAPEGMCGALDSYALCATSCHTENRPLARI